MSIRPLALALLCLLVSPPLEAASHTWSGAVDGNWSNPGNWSAGGPPANGEADVVLTFPLAASNKIMHNDVTVQNINTIDFGGGYALYGNTLPMSGSIGVRGNGAVHTPIVLQSPLVMVIGWGPLSLTGVISGGFGISTSASTESSPHGLLALQGVNHYTGVTLVSSGTLEAFGNQPLGAGNGLPETGTVVLPGAQLEVGGFIANEHLSIGGAGFRRAAFEAINGPGGSMTTTWSGPIELTEDTTIGCEAVGLVLAGSISGPFALTFIGGRATIRLAAVATYTGDTTLKNLPDFGGVLVHDLRVEVSGSVASSAFRMTPGAYPSRLFLAPGAAIGGFDAGQGSGLADRALAVTGPTAGSTSILGDLSLANATATLSVRIQGAATFDRMSITGAVLVTGGARLLVDSSAFDPAGGTTYVIVDNDGADPIAGTFAGLPEGWTFTANARNYRISYVGGDGNDITLTRVVGTPVELQEFSAE